MVNLKVNKKELVKAAKENERPERSNFTFRLNTGLMEAFKAACKKEGVTTTAVIEEFLRGFTKH